MATALATEPHAREKLAWMLPAGDGTEAGRGERDDGEGRGRLAHRPVEDRFDLQGRAVPRGADVSVTAGLHHHGAEPERAGYTVRELLHLTRSAVAAQRAAATAALAALLRRRRDAIYSRDEPPLPSSLPPEVGLAIRLALDQTTASGLAAAVEALEAYLTPPAEVVAAAVEGLAVDDYRGHELLPLGCTGQAPFARQVLQGLLPASIAPPPPAWRPQQSRPPATSTGGDLGVLEAAAADVDTDWLTGSDVAWEREREASADAWHVEELATGQLLNLMRRRPVEAMLRAGLLQRLPFVVQVRAVWGGGGSRDACGPRPPTQPPTTLDARPCARVPSGPGGTASVVPAPASRA